MKAWPENALYVCPSPCQNESVVTGPIPILYIHHERALGGAPLSLLYLLRRLDRERYAPRVICLREGPAADLFRQDGLPVQIVGGPDLSHTELVWFRWWQFPRLAWRILASIPLFFRLRKALKDSAFCVPHSPLPLVHLNSSTLLIGALAARSLALPVLWHIREPLAKGYLGIRRWLLRRAIACFADEIIAISNHDAAQLGTGTRASVIHNFVDFAQFNPEIPQGMLKKELRIPDDAPVILFLGGDATVKGAEVFLDALPVIFDALRSAHAVIAGETSAEYQLRLAGSGLAACRNRIHLLGPRSDVPALLADASVLVFPAIVPHFARPVIEAAAMARPVVASDLGGIRELVVPNETGVLVPANDPPALAGAVVDLVRDGPRAFRLGQQGLALAREKFDARRNATATFGIYERIIQPPPPCA